MKKTLHKSFFLWLPFAALVTFACGISYLLVQQNMRMDANDPQVQIAGDIAGELAQGAPAQEIIPPGQQIDMRTSLDPYAMIFDASGNALGSSVVLDGHVPVVPSGIFADAKQNGQDRLTWQPASGVRSAIVIQYVSGSATASSSFVLAGRSLTEVEINESKILRLTELAWILGLIVMFGIVLALVVTYQKKQI